MAASCSIISATALSGPLPEPLDFANVLECQRNQSEATLTVADLSREQIETAGPCEIDYIEFVDPQELTPMTSPERTVVSTWKAAAAPSSRTAASSSSREMSTISTSVRP